MKHMQIGSYFISPVRVFTVEYKLKACLHTKARSFGWFGQRGKASSWLTTETPTPEKKSK